MSHQNEIIQCILDIDPDLSFRILKLGSPHSLGSIKELRHNIESMSGNQLSLRANDILKDANSRKLSLYFRPNDYRFILLDLDNIPPFKWENILKEFRGRGSGYYGTAHSKHESIRPYLIIQTSKTGRNSIFNCCFFCPEVTNEEEYAVVAKWLAQKYIGDLGASQKHQVGRFPCSYNYKKRTAFYTKVILLNSRAKLILDDRVNPLDIHKQKVAEAERQKVRDKHDRKHRNLKKKGVHSHAHKHPHTEYDHEDMDVRLSQITQVPSQQSLASNEGNSYVAHGSNFPGHSDCAFIAMVRERDSSKSRDDLINILSSQSSSSKSSVVRTVDSVISSSQDSRSKSYSYNSEGMRKYVKK